MEQEKRSLDTVDLEYKKIAAELAETMAEEAFALPQQFLPKAALRQRYQHELEMEFSQHRNRLERGIELLVGALTKQSIESQAPFSEQTKDDTKLLESLSSLAEEQLQVISEKAAQGESLQKLLQISDRTMENLYHIAKHLYEEKKFEESRDSFLLLTTLDEKNYAFWMGLGNSDYYLGNYEDALYAYALAYENAPHEPSCHIMSSYCYKYRGDYENAFHALDSALSLIDAHHEYADWKEGILEAKRNLQVS